MNDTIIPDAPIVPSPESTFEKGGGPTELANLILALSKARAAMDPVLADTTGQFKDRKFQYADLASMYRSLIPALAKEGIAVIHPNCQVNTELQRASTMVAGHGAYLMVSNDFAGAPTDANVKGMGSMLTYLNRYQLRGLCAIAGDDDPDNDGQKATAPFRSLPKPAQVPQGGRTRAQDSTEKKEPAANNAAPADADAPDNAPLPKGSELGAKLSDLFRATGFGEPREKRDAFILEVIGKDFSPTGKALPMTYGDARRLVAALEARGDK